MHCERTDVERQQCIVVTVVRRRDGPRWLSDHDVYRRSAVYDASRADALECTPATISFGGLTRRAIRPHRQRQFDLKVIEY